MRKYLFVINEKFGFEYLASTINLIHDRCTTKKIVFFYKSLLVYNSSFLTCVLPGKKTCHLCRPTFHVHKAYITYVADIQVNSFS